MQKWSSSSLCQGIFSLAVAQTRNTCQTACPANSPPGSPAPKNACVKQLTWVKEPERLGYFINIFSFFGSCESPPQDLTTVDGTSIWAGDGVHLTSNASRVAARKLMADLARGGKEGEPAHKRTRLESIVPAPAPAKKKGAAAGQPPTSPPRPVPPPTLLWLSGQLPPSQRGRGSGPHNNNQRGGGPVRGCGPRAERAAQGRPARPLGTLVKVLRAVGSRL